MKKILKVSILSAIVVLSSSAAGFCQRQGGSDERDIKKAVSKFITAFNTNNVVSIDKQLSNDFFSFGKENKILDKVNFENYINGLKSKVLVVNIDKIKFLDIKIRSDKAAVFVAYNVSFIKFTTSKTMNTTIRRFILLDNTSGRWKISAWVGISRKKASR